MATSTRSATVFTEGNLWGAGSYHWANLANLASSNNTYATCTRTGTAFYSYTAIATDFGFTIPTGSTINSILVTIEGKSSDLVSRIDYVNLIIPGGGLAPFTAMGYYPADSDPDQPLTNSDDTYDFSPVHSGSGDLWGYGWTPALVNDADFGVGFDLRLDARSVTISIDHISVTIDYTEDTPSTEDVCDSLPCDASLKSLPDAIKSLIASYATGRSELDGCIGVKLNASFRFCTGLTDLSECGTKYTLEEAFKAAMENDGCDGAMLRVFVVPVLNIEVL